MNPHPTAPSLLLDLADRLGRAEEAMRSSGITAMLVSPGPDLRYLCGYEALPLERLTCLVLQPGADPVLVVPGLEKLAAQASPAGELGIDLRTWDEVEDPYEIVASMLSAADVVAVDNHMWAEKSLRFRAALPHAAQVLAGPILAPMRALKSTAEIEALTRAGAAIDAVHVRMPEWLRPGRTEREIGRDIADAIIDSGHVRVDFVIVGSGPNGASPHHELSDRVVAEGEPVVIDIGGTMPDGYCSDSTRMYCIGDPPAPFLEYYGVLQRAQHAQVEAVRPGITAAELDAVGRDIITDAGFGDRFIHRTGHGIGLETHEEPYIVAGSTTPLRPGHAFSIEPGIYCEGEHGARIEDIVICGEHGAIPVNLTTHDLVIV